MHLKHLYPAALIAALAIVGVAAFIAGSAPSAVDVATPPSAPETSPPSATTSTYTLADVAAHNSASSCYTAINGNVYDLTSFISEHPGGEAAILSICGKDGTQAFEAQHANSHQANAQLALLRIGTLAP